jgi:hypothetical protein
MKYLALTIPVPYGDPTNIIPPSGIPTGGPSTLSNIISTGLNLAMVVAVIACLLMLILGGFNWITSEGDKQKVASARNRILFSVIGLIVVFASFMIINIIYAFFFGTGVTSFLGNQPN